MPEMDKKSSVSITCIFLLRVLTFIFLLIALIVTATNKLTQVTINGPREVKFKDFGGYRYMVSTTAVGFVYNLLQMTLSICTLVSGNRPFGNVSYIFDFFGDKIISYLLLSGSAAGFSYFGDLNTALIKSTQNPFNSFVKKAIASASLVLIGFLCTAITSIFSSFALPKKV
ncbi:CASP-like protein 4D1 [Lotus japonicus]|uniref:CASP-like protein 4D1 n=1 Tax=Lotus japonicus TaxID=34305 RepID=UPI00258C2C5F|nr:CASP-like protein 4D1 [Lotus japonicus]